MRNAEVKKLNTEFWTESDCGSKQDNQLLFVRDDRLNADEIDFFPSAISDSCTLVLL